MNNDWISNRIRRLRFDHGETTQQQLAARSSSFARRSLAIEAGKYAPSLPLAFRIARAFNTSVEDVFQYGRQVHVRRWRQDAQEGVRSGARSPLRAGQALFVRLRGIGSLLMIHGLEAHADDDRPITHLPGDPKTEMMSTCLRGSATRGSRLRGESLCEFLEQASSLRSSLWPWKSSYWTSVRPESRMPNEPRKFHRARPMP